MPAADSAVSMLQISVLVNIFGIFCVCYRHANAVAPQQLNCQVATVLEPLGALWLTKGPNVVLAFQWPHSCIRIASHTTPRV